MSRKSVFFFLSLLTTLNCLSLHSAAQERNPPDEDRDINRQRSEWFYRQRAYPHKHVPNGARRRSLRELDRKLAAEAIERARVGKEPLGSPSWTSIGPLPIDTPYNDAVVSGRVSALAIDPTNINPVYAGGAQGGIWKSTNAGSTWTALTDAQDSLAVGSIAVDPNNPSTIYVGTGEGNFSGDSYYGEGILKSTDGGSTWTHICGPFCGPIGPDSYYGGGAHIGGLVIDPFNSQVLLAAVQLSGANGIYRSADAGNTWTLVLTGNPGTSVIFDPVNTGVAYAGLGAYSGGTDGVYKSSDAGQTWTTINGTLPVATAGRIVLALAPSSPTTLYASLGTTGSGSLLGFFKSTNGGVSWTQLTATPNYCNPQCWYDNVVAVQPTNPNVIFAGGAFSVTLIRSMDGGNTWTTLQSAAQNGSVHADMHALAFAPDGNTLYLGNDGGVNVTTQVTAKNPIFTQLNSDLAITQFYPGLAIDQQNVAHAIGGNQDNGTVIYNGSLTWNQVTCGDGGYAAIDAAVSNTMYAACQQINILKSTTGGSSWQSAHSGINNGDRVDFIAPMVMDPSQSSTLYFGTYRVYQTTNGAGSWTAISPDLTGGSGFWAVITSIAVAPSDSNTVYAGTGDDHVQVTTNAGAGVGATWIDHSSGLPPRVLTYLAVDPTAATTAYVTFSGFTGFGDSLGHIFKTTNSGTTWTDISGNLPNVPVNVVVVDPDSPSLIFVATDIGVFYTTSGGSSWTSLVTGLPRVAVLGLTLHSASKTLRASTHGRGVWDIDISSLLGGLSITSLSPSSAIAGGPAFPMTVNGTGFDSTSVVQWNGANLATTFVSTTQLTAMVSAGDIAVAGTFQVTVFNADSGQTSNAVPFTVNNPVPALTALSPSAKVAGSKGFTLTVTGSNFVKGAAVQFNGNTRTTTYISATQLKAAILAGDLTTPGSFPVTATNPLPGGGISNSLTFTVKYPVPKIKSFNPPSATAGGPAFTLTINGSNFVAQSIVKWKGSPRTTTFVSSTELQAAITASDIAVGQKAKVSVVNPAPGGGTKSATFVVNNPVPAIVSLIPDHATHGGPAFTLTVNGSNFVPNSVVNWNGAKRTTTFINSGQLSAAISAKDIVQAGTAQVTAVNGAPGGGTSNPLTFTIQ